MIPFARNARTHSDTQVSQIASSIREWGWTNPVLVAEDGTIIAGHGRVLAARKLRIADVPVMTATGWTDAQKRAYAIADNKLTLNGGWDDELLGLELGEFEVLGFDLDLIGFTEGEREILAAQFTEGLTDPDAVPDLPSEPIARTGDVWVLGRHRLVCGDSTSPEDTEKLLGGVKPHLMITDPPYGVNYDPAWRKRAGETSTPASSARWRTMIAPTGGKPGRCFRAQSPTSGMRAGIRVRSSNRWKRPASTCAPRLSGPRTGLPLAAAIIIGSTSPVGMRSGEQPGRTGVGTASNRHFGISSRVTTMGMATE